LAFFAIESSRTTSLAIALSRVRALIYAFSIPRRRALNFQVSAKIHGIDAQFEVGRTE
jgi:hypothetical protein